MKRRDFIKLGLIAAPALSLSYRARSEEAELVVGSNVGSPPFAFKEGDHYSGFDIEVWAEVAKGLNRKWRVQPMEFGALIPALQTRNIDAIVSQLFIKPERQKVIDFSDPYYLSGLIAVTGTNNTDIRTPDDLAGKTIGTETGTIAVEFIKEHIKGATVAQLPTINNALLALEAGRTDAVIYDMPALMYYANNAGKGKVRVIRPPLEGRDVGIGFQKGSPLVATANTTLTAMKADGRLKSLREKWFGTEPA
ncbi:transporter substrate-binding domain-containing protein [Bradyrhizobium sp. INPA01-394B]|uniref:Transporter substrate-binding domain-containing protein n=1 Tax=Bradyrhizobium campsiandrae TaxID=1729892 RepID=A0ABR7U4Y3_9BRAD|nr:transporter substrate-binding domain-containing protein [Bradyrhizobium campsiandrae]MBC9879891.1 transporter substrate-binding domain-containing protein [Bradyrhizobium campsiandrae]MBC9978576.1 transporter substrate-binding domain-containing protein [Bradyrhizobium campsiandrae]